MMSLKRHLLLLNDLAWMIIMITQAKILTTAFYLNLAGRGLF